jgi:hypothetical protein
MKAFLWMLAICAFALTASGCEPKPPKPKTDFNHERSTL